MKTASRLLVAAAAASMAFAPIAAHANTRASDRTAVYNVSASQPGIGREDDGEQVASGVSIILALLASAAIIGGIIFASDSDDDGQSPGT